ncbi:magnesium and cobalt transport protein CorA [Rhodothermaceae bacterium RA]|nr:magnesium and cobalt transport protein CorA [Rhodothermaceae bacterium RA]
MLHPHRKRTHKLGLPPGSLVYVGERPNTEVTLSVIRFSEDVLESTTATDVPELARRLQQPGTFWIDIDGVHDVGLIEQIGRLFHIDPLTLEDIVTTTQRPRFSDDGDHLFIVTRELSFDAAKRVIRHEQVSMIVGKHVLLTFQERPGDVFDIVRSRLRQGRGQIRQRGPDYLAYALLDVILDHYFLVMDEVGEETARLEEALLSDTADDAQSRLNRLRRELILVRRAVYPVREQLHAFLRSESPLIHPETRPFLKDALEHARQIADTMDALRDLLTSLTDQYTSDLSRRLNEVMKLLTIISTIFIPLTFIAGIYGMNFRYMPELASPYGYPIVLLVMLGIAVSLLMLFKRRGWL